MKENHLHTRFQPLPIPAYPSLNGAHPPSTQSSTLARLPQTAPPTLLVSLAPGMVLGMQFASHRQSHVGIFASCASRHANPNAAI
jgi:hypothetical protein